MVERLNRTLRDAFYSGYVGSYVSQAINELLEEFVRYDNEERCHTAMVVSQPSFGLKLWKNLALLFYDKSTYPQH